MLSFSAIWWIEHSVSRGIEYPLSRRNDTRPDDSWDGRVGYEEDWPSQEHLDGYEAEPGEDAGRGICHACAGGWCRAAVQELGLEKSFILLALGIQHRMLKNCS